MNITQEWLNHNANRNYPFKEDASRKDGAFELPNSTLLDFSMTTYLLNVGDKEVRLLSLAVDPGGTSLTFTFEFGGYYTLPIVVSAASPVPYEGVARVDLSPGTAWVIMKPLFGSGIQEIANDVTTHGNTYTFADLRINPGNTAQLPFGLVTSIIGDEAPEASQVPLTGDVKFDDGYNVAVRFSRTQNTIKFSARVGAGKGVPCEPLLEDPADCEQGIYYINGLHPDWAGRFTLEGRNDIEVENDPDNNKIILSTPVNPDKPRCEE